MNPFSEVAAALLVDREDERIVDALVAKRTASMTTRHLSSEQTVSAPIVTADATNYATLTIGRESVPVSDVNVVDDRGLAAIHEAARVKPVQYFFAMHVCESDVAVRYSPPRWYRLRTRRTKKAAAKRKDMRDARYAARWEQAHLRGEK